MRKLNQQFALVILALISATLPLCPQVRSTPHLSVDPGSVRLGSPTKLEATVTPLSTGKVYFLDGPTLLGVGAVDANGKAVIFTTLLPSGQRQLRAIYEGTAGTAGSASPAVPVTVVSQPAAEFSSPDDYATSGGAYFIAAGDLDNDGHPDLIVVNQTNSVSILLGNADGSFRPGGTYLVGNSPRSVAIADFNGDGNVDLAVANSGSGTISILFGTGRGDFQSAIDGPAVAGAFAIAAADLNGDGRADLVVTSDSGNSVNVFLGNDDGSFQPARVFATGAQPRSIAIVDLNADGKPDLAVANSGGNSISVLLGNGDGTFVQAAFLPMPVGLSPASVIAGDFNGDGKPDLAVVNTGSNSVSVLLGEGDGTFRIHGAYATGSEPSSITVVDFNADGVLDLVVAHRSGEISLLLGAGDGSFQVVGKYAGGAEPSGIIAADFNGDGSADLAISSARTSQAAGSTRVLLAAAATTTVLTVAPSASTLGDTVTLTATVSPPGATGTVLFSNGASPIGTSTVLAGQAVLRTVLLPAGMNVIRATYAGDSTHAASTSAPVIDSVKAAGSPGFSSPAKTFPADGSASAVVIGDFNGDGRPDLAVTNPLKSDVSILLGNGDATFQPAANYAAVAGAGPLAMADFNGDGVPDLVVGGSSAVAVLRGAGNGGFQAPASTPVSGSVSSIAVADFNRDGKPDLVLATGAKNVVVMLGNGDGTFQAPNIVPADVLIPAVAVADVDNDGIADLVAPGFVFRGKGDGTFLAPQPFATGGLGAIAIATGDFNGDGNVDLAIAHAGSPGACDVAVLLGLGNGAFSSPVCKALSAVPNSIAVGDFNGDGHLDVAVVNGNSSIATLLLGKGDGTFPVAGNFALPAAAGTPMTSQTLAVGDLNLDGRSDLAVAAFDKVTIVAGVHPAPASINVIAGSPQSASLGTAFAIQLQAQVLDNQRAPVRGVTVTFAAPGSGSSGTFPSGGVAFAVTDSSGIATAPVFTANGVTGGPYAVNATVVGVAKPATFLLTNINPVPPTISVVSGMGQRASAQAPFGNPLIVQVLDPSKNPASGVMVMFSAPSSGPSGTFAGGGTTAIVQSNSNGIAASPGFTANGLHGKYAVTVNTTDGTASLVMFNLTNLGPPANITFANGISSTAAVATTFKQSILATVADDAGDPISGISVTFTAPSNGPSGTFAGGSMTAIATTDSNGVATAPAFTANTKAGGPYAINASVAGLKGLFPFVLTNTPGLPTSITNYAGSPQAANLNQIFGTSLQVSVQDAYGNAVAATAATFTASASALGASGTFASPGSGGTVTVNTNSQGIATAPAFKANAAAGPYTVTVTVSANPGATPATFSLKNQGGLVTSAPASATFTSNLADGKIPADQALALSGPGAVDFTVTQSPDSKNWLTVTPSGTTTPAFLNLSLNTSVHQLAPGTYTATITINSATDQSTVTVTLKVLIPFDTLPDTVTFDYVLGDPIPSPKGLPVTSMLFPIPVTVSTPPSDWLKFSPQTGTTPLSVALSVNPAGLTPNQFTTMVRIDSPYASNGPVSVRIVLNIRGQVTASPSSASFTYVAGQNPPASQQVNVASGTGIVFTATAADNFVKALVVTGVTPGQVSISVDPTGLPAGDYTSSVKITANNSQVMGTTIPVMLKVRSSLSISPASISVSGKSSKTINVMSAGPPLDYSVTTSGQSWFSVDGARGTTPGSINVTIDSTGLSPNTYSGSITISSPLAVPSSLTVSITLTIPGTFQVTPDKELPVFQAPASGKLITQTFGLSSSNPTQQLPFTVTTAGVFLSASPTSGVTPATITATIDPGKLAPGDSAGTITFTSGQVVVTRNIAVTVPKPQPKLDISPPLAQIQVQTGQSISTKVIIQNVGTGDNLRFSTAPAEPLRTPWLTTAQSDAVISTTKPLFVQLNVDARSLPAGVYYTSIALTLDNTPQPSIPVSVVVTGVRAMINLDFVGVAFNVRQGQGSSVFQDVRVLDDSPDQSFSWKAQVLPGGPDFVSIDSGTETGTSSKSTPGKFTLRIKNDFTSSPANRAGTYSATIRISSSQAANAERFFTVVLNLQDPGQTNAAPILQPTGVVFVARQGSDPLPQTIKVSTSSQSPVTFQASAQTYTGPDKDAGTGVQWITPSVNSGSTSTDNAGSVDAVIHTAGLTPGIYTAGLTVSIGSTVQTVNVTLVIVQGTVAGGKSPQALDAVAGCSPSKLIPTFVGGLVNNFSAQVGGPVPITIKVIDDCGNLVPDPTVAGSPKADVTIQFSSGDPSAKVMQLTDPKNAAYTITWIPDTSSVTTTATVQAKLGDLSGAAGTGTEGSTAARAAATAAASLDGIPAKVTGKVDGSQTPVLVQNATLNNFNPQQRGAPLAPGTVVQIYGANLATGDDPISAQSAPLPVSLGGTSVMIGGIAAPLYYVSKTQINAQIPFELTPGQYEIRVVVNGQSTAADQINVAPASPGLLAASDGTVIAQHSNGDPVSSDSPAHAGETIVLYLVGMGLTTPAVASGAASPSDPLAAVVDANQPVVTLDNILTGGVLFAGLAPGYVGLYQINYTIPDDIQPGLLMLTITQNGFKSNSAVLALGPPASTPRAMPR